MQTRHKLRIEVKPLNRPRCASLGVDVVVCAFVDHGYKARAVDKLRERGFKRASKNDNRYLTGPAEPLCGLTV